MANDLKITVTIQNLDKIQSAIEKAEKATKEVKDALWELATLKHETLIEKE